MLPKVILQRSEVISLEKKRVTMAEAKNEKHIIKSFDRLTSEEKKHATEELKVMKRNFKWNLNIVHHQS